MGFAVTSYQGSTPVIGLLSARINSQQELLNLNQNQTTLGVNISRYNEILEPCEALDNKLIEYIDDISTDKTSIVNLADGSNFYTHPIYYNTENNAQTATENLFDDVLTSIEVMPNLNFIGLNVNSNTTFTTGAAVTTSDGGSGTVAITRTSQIGNPFSVIIAGVAGTFGIGSTVFLTGIAFTSISSVNYVGTGQIYPDNTIVTYYPDLEPADPTVDNPYGDLQLKVLDTPVSGLGIANTFYKNSLTDPNTLGNIVDSDDTISSLGTVYTFDTTSGSSVKTSIDNLITSIDSNRTNSSTMNGNSSTIKNLKKGYSVNIWSLEKSNDNIQSNITDLQSAIAILEDPANGGPY